MTTDIATVGVLGWYDVLVWRAVSYDEKSVEVIVHSEGATYGDDDDTIVDLGISYEVKLSEFGMDGEPVDYPDEGTVTYYTHHGHGATLDEAGGNALAQLRAHDHYLKRMVRP